MSDPFEVLMAEHRLIEKVVRALRGMAEDIEAGRRPPVEDLEKATDFIRTFADACHHHKEEDHLFPELERHGIPRDGPIGVMLHEHEEGRGFVRGINEGLREVKGGKDSGYETFADNALAYVDVLENHIPKEDDILYPMGRSVLSDEVCSKLLESFERVEEGLGSGVHENFHKIAEELYSKYG